MVTLAGPLGANMPLTTVTPIAFTLTDGVQTISNLNATSSFFFFITGPTGAIVNWSVAASTPGGTFITSTWADGDEGKLVTGRGFNRMAGVWTITGAVPDTGSTLTMLTLTLMVLGLVARRFQRAAG
jgi:hypothetical protein